MGSGAKAVPFGAGLWPAKRPPLLVKFVLFVSLVEWVGFNQTNRTNKTDKNAARSPAPEPRLAELWKTV
jgi:hypothetical protein